MKVQLHVFLTSTTHSGEQSPALLPGQSAPGLLTKRGAPGGSQGRSERYHRTVGCIAPAGIRTLVRRSS